MRDPNEQVVATTGGLLDRMEAGIQLSERKRAAAARRAERVRMIVQREFAIRDRAEHRSSPESQVSATAELRVEQDPVVKANIAGEQWGARLATMYATSATAVGVEFVQDQLTKLIEQGDEQLRLMRRMVDALERIAARQDLVQ